MIWNVLRNLRFDGDFQALEKSLCLLEIPLLLQNFFSDNDKRACLV